MTFSSIAPTVIKHLDEVSLRFEIWIQSDIEFIQEYIQHCFAKPGKMLRPLAVLICSGYAEKKNVQKLDLAVAVELIHVASLVHDDVIDDSEFRRGMVTLQKKWGQTSSILFGDFLLSRAISILPGINEPEVIKSIADATSKICEGELLQNHFRNNFNLAQSHYLQIIEYKTASLIGAACYTGALLGGYSKKIQDTLYQIGIHIGIAFQLYDDCLDFIGDQSVMGKPAFSDSTNGFATLPLIYLLNNENGQLRKDIFQALQNIKDTKNQEWIRSILLDKKYIAQVQNLASEYTQHANTLLDSLPDPSLRDNLRRMGEFIIHRNR